MACILITGELRDRLARPTPARFQSKPSTHTRAELDQELAKRESEADFQRWVIEQAQARGGRVHATRPARTKKGWRTPIQGDKGFPDLVPVHPEQKRLIFAEVKRDGDKRTPAQEDWYCWLFQTKAEVYIWRPGDWETIVDILGEGRLR